VANAKRAVENAVSEDEREEAAHWLYQIQLAEKSDEKWIKQGDRILKEYSKEPIDDNYAQARKFNILWSNVQTLKPSLYGREPVPIAERRFLDKDVVGRVASQILERAMRYEMMDCNFHDSVTACVYDYLLVGRGVAWMRFVPAFGDASSLAQRGDDQLEEYDGSPVEDDKKTSAAQDAHDESPEKTDEKLIGARTFVDYVNWRDFLHSKARTWDEVEWIARKYRMTRKDLIDNFGKKIGEDVPLEKTDHERLNDTGHRDRLTDSMAKATVFEIWSKWDRKVRFIAQGYHRFLEEPREDPLNLEGFFPIPKPLFATLAHDTITPTPDYEEYRDQAMELNQLTLRINLLLSALRVAGVYDSSFKELARLLDEGGENKLIPVASWNARAEKGGLESAISFLPMKEVAETVMQLFEARDKIKNDLYEITGLSDILRGQADPRETATSIKTKGRFGSMRLQDRQAEVARFCRDIIRMMGEIISEHYPDDTLIEVSGIMYDEGVGPDMPTPPSPPHQQRQQSPQQGPQGALQLPPPQGLPVPQNGAGGPPMRRPVPGGPPMRGPDGQMYIHAPHAGGPYQRVVQH
jgi:hypothetical protein